MNDLMQRILITFGALLVGNIPVWIIVGFKCLLQAEGFWQNLVVWGLGFYFLGAVQLFLWLFLVVFLYGVWFKT